MDKKSKTHPFITEAITLEKSDADEITQTILWLPKMENFELITSPHLYFLFLHNQIWHYVPLPFMFFGTIKSVHKAIPFEKQP